ncbi:hypothetical protein Tco_1264061 [Tanacetum coccineum]
MENFRITSLNGIQEGDRKIVWVKWIKVLAAKKFGGLGVSSFFALNRGLIAKWDWRFISGDNSLWCKFISATHGSSHSYDLICDELVCPLVGGGVQILLHNAEWLVGSIHTPWFYTEDYPWKGLLRYVVEFVVLSYSISFAKKKPSQRLPFLMDIGYSLFFVV